METRDQSPIGAIDEGTFAAEAQYDGSEMHVRLRGTADLTVKSHMDRLLCDIHAQMARSGGTHVNVDISAVEFMNSSCLKALVIWVTTARDMPGRRYQITFVFKPDVWWQRRGLNPIVALSDGIASTRPSNVDPDTKSG